MMDLTEKIRDLNEKDNEGNTFLHMAAKTNDIKFAWYLHKLNPNMNFNVYNNVNNTPLHIACKYHHMDLVKHIYRYRGKIELVNNEGKKPFDYLTDKELIEMNEFRDKIFCLGKYGYKPRPEGKHHGLTSTAF